MRESQFTLTPNGSHSFKGSHVTYQGNIVLNPLQSSDDDDSDWDSEPDLELAPVQEASRVQRTVPSVIRKTPTKQTSPYYCQEIGPQLDLGYQWPQRQQPVGFVKVNRSNSTTRRKRTDQGTVGKKTILLQATVFLKDTYSAYNPTFNYNTDKVPKRILTKPSRPVQNDGNDNENFDYILKVNEILGQDPNYQYRVIDLLGQGTFGQVVKCERVSTGELFSVKVIKNKSAYKTQTGMEIEILKKLNKHLDPDDKHHILRLFHVFNHKHHLCLVFELLSYNLYDLIGHNGYKGFPPETVRAFAVQILDTLSLLKEAKIIHCDLKPENILLESEKSLTIKVIDFGSSCHEANRVYSYLQSRFYRSPEVLLGMKYTGAIDVWSFGCIVAELFLGLPLFPGSSEYNQLFRIVEMLGIPSKDMLSKGRNTNVFFNRHQTGADTFEYTLKSRDQYNQENNKNELPRKKYFQYTLLEDIILKYNHGNPSLSKEEEKRQTAAESIYSFNQDKELQVRECILDFLRGVLELNPLKRWTPQQALQHPFITQKPYIGPFKPDGYITPVVSTSTGLSGVNTDATLKTPVRRRAESLGKPIAPDQLQQAMNKIQSPISKYKETQAYSQEPPSEAYRQRNTRSQGDYVGMLPPDGLFKKTSSGKKVTISPKIKVRTGSHDTMRVSEALESRNAKDTKKYHAGEAAGGLLMMGQNDEQKLFNQQKWTMTGTFKRRA